MSNNGLYNGINNGLVQGLYNGDFNGLASGTSDNTVTPSNPNIIPLTDPDALKYIIAAGITSLLEKTAVNQLVLDLKFYGLWSKLYYLMPYLGGTSASCSYNLIDPTQFQMTWNGGWTFSSNGAQPNGVNGYGYNNFNPATYLTLNDSSILIYSKTDGISTGVDFGCGDGTINSRFYTYIRTTSSRAVSGQYNTTTGALTTPTNTSMDGSGMFIFNRCSSSVHRILRNNILLGSKTTSGGTLPNYNAYIGAFNDGGTPIGFSGRQIALNAVAKGLTAIEETNMNNIIIAFQTTLGRA